MSQEYKIELLFDLMQSEADVLYFIRNAEKPAIVIISSPVGHFPKRRGDRYTLWFGQGIERHCFKRLKEAQAKAEEILKRTKSEIYVREEWPRKKRKNKVYLVSVTSNLITSPLLPLGKSATAPATCPHGYTKDCGRNCQVQCPFV